MGSPVPPPAVKAMAARQAAEVTQKVYLGVVNNVVTREEARNIIDLAGGGDILSGTTPGDGPGTDDKQQ